MMSKNIDAPPRDETQALGRRVQQFLVHEAGLMDLGDFEGWLALWVKSDPIEYRIPTSWDGDDDRRVSIVRDDRERLEARISRYSNPAVHSQEPKPQLVRAVSNVEFTYGEGGLLSVECVWFLHAYRSRKTTTLAGRSHYDLALFGEADSSPSYVEISDAFRIRRKLVKIVGSEHGMPSLVFLL